VSFLSRAPEVFRTDRRGWIGAAIQAVLEGDDILVIDDDRRCFVAARSVPANRPAWTTIWRALRDAGIKAPRRPGWGK